MTDLPLILGHNVGWSYFRIMTIQNVLFLSVILTLLYMLRNKDARLLKGIALIGFIKLVLPPLFTLESGGNPILSLLNSFTHGQVLHNYVVVGKLCWHDILFFSWSLAVFILVAKIVYENYMLRKFVHTTEKIDLNIDIEGKKLRNLEFRISKGNHSPIVTGFLKHKIILPADWHTWPEKLRKTILSHELAHLRQRDHWIYILESVALAVNFFNPLVWILRKKLNAYKEMVCDDQAVSIEKVSPLNYSRDLIHVAEMLSKSNQSFAASYAFSESGKELHKRVKYQIAKDSFSIPKLSVKSLALLAFMGFSILPMSFYSSKQKVSCEPSDVKVMANNEVKVSNMPSRFTIKKQ